MSKFIIILICTIYASDCFAANLLEQYDSIKEKFTEQTGINFGLDNTTTVQYSPSDNGQTLIREFATPYLNAKLFNNSYGKGNINFLMNIVRFHYQDSSELSSKIGVANQINNYDTDYNELSELYYTYTLGGSYDWLTLGLGQFSFAAFDNLTVGKLQNQYFLNNALSQNGTFTYPSAGVGGFASAVITSDLSVSLGSIDASNPMANGIHAKNLHNKKYASFTAIHYTPKWNNRHQASYNLLFYNKPSVEKAPADSRGISLYMAQDISAKTSLFFRFNYASGNYAALDNSYSAGILYNNPFNRETNDQLAIAYGYNKVNKDTQSQLFHKYEHTLETYYNYHINKRIALRPDIQLYINPAFDKKSKTSGVFSLSAYIGL